MGKKMKLPSVFQNKNTRHLSWHWPSCKQSQTLSFRATGEMFKTLNSVFFNPSDEVETAENWFTNSSECASISSESEVYSTGESLEMIIRGVRSERLFFKPGDTSSILEEAKAAGEVLPFKESVVMALESADPYDDFKRSMEEMVETHGLKDWDCLKELLGWYMKMNDKVNHGFIVGAFVDLMLGLTSCSDITSFSSAASSFSYPSPSSPVSPADIDGDGHDKKQIISM